MAVCFALFSFSFGLSYCDFLSVVWVVVVANRKIDPRKLKRCKKHDLCPLPKLLFVIM